MAGHAAEGTYARGVASLHKGLTGLRKGAFAMPRITFCDASCNAVHARDDDAEGGDEGDDDHDETSDGGDGDQDEGGRWRGRGLTTTERARRTLGQACKPSQRGLRSSSGEPGT